MIARGFPHTNASSRRTKKTLWPEYPRHAASGMFANARRAAEVTGGRHNGFPHTTTSRNSPNIPIRRELKRDTSTSNGAHSAIFW